MKTESGGNAACRKYRDAAGCGPLSRRHHGFRVAHFRRRTPIFEALDRPGFYRRLRNATLAAAAVAEPPGCASPSAVRPGRETNFIKEPA
jgi:hypothetical protein